MTDKDIKTISEKIDSLHKKILESKFAEKVTESEMVSLILAVKELNRQKAEIENLNIELQAMRGAANSYKAEVERMQENIQCVMSANVRLINQVGKAKAEAIKEFAEQVQEEIADALHSNYKARGERTQEIPIYTDSEFLSYCSGKIDCLRGLADFIDDIVKEMVGENK